MKLSTIALCLAASPFFSYAADGSLTAQERAQVIQLLTDSRKELLAAVSDLTDEQWKWKPTPERWSVGEVAEHIMLGEGGLYNKMQEALKNPPNPEWETKTKGKTELLLQVMASRLGKAKSPEEIVPQGNKTR